MSFSEIELSFKSQFNCNYCVNCAIHVRLLGNCRVISMISTRRAADEIKSEDLGLAIGLLVLLQL